MKDILNWLLENKTNILYIIGVIYEILARLIKTAKNYSIIDTFLPNRKSIMIWTPDICIAKVYRKRTNEGVANFVAPDNIKRELVGYFIAKSGNDIIDTFNFIAAAILGDPVNISDPDLYTRRNQKLTFDFYSKVNLYEMTIVKNVSQQVFESIVLGSDVPFWYYRPTIIHTDDSPAYGDLPIPPGDPI